jgi:hypothetical protein
VGKPRRRAPTSMSCQLHDSGAQFSPALLSRTRRRPLIRMASPADTGTPGSALRDSEQPEDGQPNKKRRTGPNARGVANLTPEQLARKRANDREAQRAIRERTKNQIDRLNQRIRDLENQQPYHDLQVVLQEKNAVAAENADIKKRLESVLGIIQPILRAQGGLNGASTASRRMLQQLTPRRAGRCRRTLASSCPAATTPTRRACATDRPAPAPCDAARPGWGLALERRALARGDRPRAAVAVSRRGADEPSAPLLQRQPALRARKDPADTGARDALRRAPGRRLPPRQRPAEGRRSQPASAPAAHALQRQQQQPRAVCAQFGTASHSTAEYAAHMSPGCHPSRLPTRPAEPRRRGRANEDAGRPAVPQLHLARLPRPPGRVASTVAALHRYSADVSRHMWQARAGGHCLHHVPHHALADRPYPGELRSPAPLGHTTPVTAVCRSPVLVRPSPMAQATRQTDYGQAIRLFRELLHPVHDHRLAQLALRAARRPPPSVQG